MRTIVGKIYANWCGHCQSLKPEWDTMKSTIKNGSNIQFIEIEEGEVNKLERFKQQFPNLEVNGYPTIFKIHPTRSIEYYNGARLSYDMEKWATSNNQLNQLNKMKKANKKTAKRKTFRNMNRKINRKSVKTAKFFGLF